MVVRELCEQTRDNIGGAYNDAPASVFITLISMIVAVLILVLFIEEVPLRASLDQGTGAAEHPWQDAVVSGFAAPGLLTAETGTVAAPAFSADGVTGGRRVGGVGGEDSRGVTQGIPSHPIGHNDLTQGRGRNSARPGSMFSIWLGTRGWPKIM